METVGAFDLEAMTSFHMQLMTILFFILYKHKSYGDFVYNTVSENSVL